MPNYDFLNLSPIDFEELTRDLLQKFYKVDFESFTNGRVRGIDLRYSIDINNNLILQCKRYKKYSDLKSTLKREVCKIQNLDINRYILVTSLGLTPSNKVV